MLFQTLPLVELAHVHYSAIRTEPVKYYKLLSKELLPFDDMLSIDTFQPLTLLKQRALPYNDGGT